MPDKRRAFPSGPPPSQGAADGLRNACETRAGAGLGSGSGVGRGSGANPGLSALPGPVSAVRRRMGAGPPRPPLIPARTCWTRLADAGSLAALCGIVCGGPLLVGMVWLPWAKHVIASKYTAQFRDGLPYAAWSEELPGPTREQGQGHGQNGGTELNNCRIQLHRRSIFTPPPSLDARTLSDGMGAVP